MLFPVVTCVISDLRVASLEEREYLIDRLDFVRNQLNLLIQDVKKQIKLITQEVENKVKPTKLTLLDTKRLHVQRV